MSETTTTPRLGLFLLMVLLLVAVGVQMLVLLTLLVVESDWLWDFEAYFAASSRLADGASPYLPEQLAAPHGATCDGCYLYPPVFAQLIWPLTLLPLALAKVVWYVLLVTAGWVSVWIAAGITGAARSPKRAAWSFIAVTFFMPAFHSVAMGNLGTIIGLVGVLVALGGVASGVSAALGMIVKLSPGSYLLVALVAGRRSAVSAVATLIAVAGISLVLSPGAWRDYPDALVNMLAGGDPVSWDLALPEVAFRAGVEGAALPFVRIAAVVAGIAVLAASVWAARRPGGMPLAVLFATVAMLVIPGTLWYHYFAVLLPLAAMAWSPATRTERGVLLTAGALIGISVLDPVPLELSIVAAAVIVVVCGRALWLPSGERSGRGGSGMTTAQQSRPGFLGRSSRPWPGPVPGPRPGSALISPSVRCSPPGSCPHPWSSWPAAP